jgi:hypothetical protein
MCQLKTMTMKMYKVVFKTFDYWGGPVKLVTRIVEAYDADHVKQLIQKNDDIIIEIKEIKQ